MDELIDLITRYMDGKISPNEFADKLLKFWRDITDEQYQAMDSVPGLREAFSKLNAGLFSWWMRKKRYMTRWTKLIAQVPKTRIQVLSEEDELLAKLFSAVEHYEPDLDVRGTEYSDELQMRREVIEALNKHKDLLLQYQ